MKQTGVGKMQVRAWMTAFLIAMTGSAVLPGPPAQDGHLFAAEVSSAVSNDAHIQAEIQKSLNEKKFRKITVRVNHGIATLSGEVDLYAYKMDAFRRARKIKDIKEVLDNIAVGGPNLPDQVLQQKLLGKIEVDREGYGQVFSAISVSVENGVVTLGGHARGPVTKDSALSLAQYMPGVKKVIDRIQVDPVNPMDDGVRLAEYNAIYNYAPLHPYAIVPSRPIRISVQDQNVTLYGVVDNKMDKELIGIRANLVPNVFHVTNNLMVASEENEKK